MQGAFNFDFSDKLCGPTLSVYSFVGKNCNNKLENIIGQSFYYCPEHFYYLLYFYFALILSREDIKVNIM